MKRFLQPTNTQLLPISLLIVVLLIIALLPRIFGLHTGLTTDEASFWQDRSARFVAALRDGRFVDTNLTGHPGVTTMWLGSTGLMMQRVLLDMGILTPTEDSWEVTATTRDDLRRIDMAHPATFPWHLTLMRLPVALATTAMILIGMLLLRPLMGTMTAFVAALLWATDPFLIAFSRLIHVDALLTMFMLLAILALLAACFDREGVRTSPRLALLLVAGSATALALLTRSSAMLLFPITILILAAWRWEFWHQNRSDHATGNRRLVLVLATWGTSTIITTWLVWPALWVAPAQTMYSMFLEVFVNGGQPQKGSFLLGTGYIYETPGALFYPVTLLARTTPWSALGLVIFGVALWSSTTWPRGQRIVLFLLGTAIVLILVALTILPKKFDRYALPVVPLLHILAACGLVWGGQRLLAMGRHRMLAISSTLIAIVVAATITTTHPYYLAYFSPLIGGSTTAPQLVPIGWGEGLDVAAEWLNAQPDIQSGSVATWSTVSLQPYLQTGTAWQGDAHSGAVHYLIVYINQIQSGKDNHYFHDIYETCTPVHTTSVNGIPYAWIYRLPLYTVHVEEAQLGDVLILEEMVLLPPNDCTCDDMTLTLVLRPQNQPHEQTFLFLHLLDAEEHVVLQRDLPLDAILPAEAWHTADTVPYTIQLPLPVETSPGSYDLVLGLYQPTTNERIPTRWHEHDGEWSSDEHARYGRGSLHAATVEVLSSFRERCLASAQTP